MGKLGLRYTSPSDVRGHLYFYIMAKLPGKNGGTEFIIQVQEKLLSHETEIPIYQFTGYYNRHKGTYTLYPRKLMNRSLLNYPFYKQDLDGQFVYDVSNIRTDLPPELRVHNMRAVSAETSLDDIF